MGSGAGHDTQLESCLIISQVSSFHAVGFVIDIGNLISGCWNRGVRLYTGVLISGCWNRGIQVSSFQGVGIEKFHCT